MASPKIKLQSNDGETFDVEVDIAKQSATIKTMLEGEFFDFNSQ
jgi:S-phase kinase-associated protein 1